KDPLLIYKFEAFELFKKMLEKTNKEVSTFLVKGNLPQKDPQEQTKLQNTPAENQQNKQLQTSRSEVGSATRSGSSGNEERQKPKAQPVRVEKKVGRNEPCP